MESHHNSHRSGSRMTQVEQIIGGKCSWNMSCITSGKRFRMDATPDLHLTYST